MDFVSLVFLIFVAATALVYFLVPSRVRWVVLLAASYIFFWLNSHYLVLVLFFATVVTFVTGKAVYAINSKGDRYIKEHMDLPRKERSAYKEKVKKQAKSVLLVGVIIVLGILLFLKYYNFFADNANVILKHFGIGMPHLGLLLPLGISFYTLQAIAYMVDVYRGKLVPDTNLAKFMLFMSFFPQIVQGPIPRHEQLAEQLYEGHDFDYTRVTYGAQLILWGFMKKLIFADMLGVPVDQVFNNYQEYTGLILFFAAAGYGIQVYADFSGGMDIARGVAQIFGIDLVLNFEQPYFSNSIENFWRRWHITLGSWMRDYIFYPLSLSKSFGNLSKKARKVFGNYIGKRLPAFLAMFIVFILVGVWHGAEWKYIAYGIYNGIFIVMGIILEEKYAQARERIGIDADSISWRYFQIFRSFILISIGRYFSRGLGFMHALRMMKLTLVEWYDLSFLLDGSLNELGLDPAHWMLMFICILVLFGVDVLHEKGIHIRETIAKQHIIFRWFIYIAAVVILLIFGTYGPEYDSGAFIYEQF